MTTLILWDIDGTLMSAGGIGAEVFDRALARTLGRQPAARLPMSGKTDPQIVGEYLTLLAVEEPERHVDAILAELERELAAATEKIQRQGRILPGVRELLDELGARPDVIQSVLTGNIAPNALVKLAAFGLEDRLDLTIGAFGSDHANRNELVPIALARARAARGTPIGLDDVWIIGDSPNDLACARAGGVHCLLVATGHFTTAELAALGPDAVVDDLSDTAAILALVLA